MTNIVERLRRYKRERSGYAEYCHQAADHIVSQDEKIRVLRDALWVMVEHNELHFGVNHSTGTQGRDALEKSK